MGDNTVLEAVGISKTFRGTGSEIEVLNDVDLTVNKSEVVGIIGASGVGKSTLLHILGSLDRPDSGEVRIGGRSIHGLSGKELDRLRSQVIGFVFQFHFLLPEFTAVENVMMPRLIEGDGPGHAADRARYWLGKVGLAERLTHKPSELSGGEQQRVAVARALAGDPQVVLADEPTGNLDDETGEEIHELIRLLSSEEGRTFVVVTHKRGFSRYADRVLLLADRRLAQIDG
jgi:lipoprotein-releasing system ATP-binding protein